MLLLIVFTAKSNNGTLLNQHRFTSTLIVFSLPMLALLWELEGKRLVQLTKVGILSLVPLSFLWGRPDYARVFPEGTSTHYALEQFQNISFQGLAAVPRLGNQNAEQWKRTLHQNLKDGDGLIVDFISWECTYYLALESGVHKKRLFIVNGATNAQLDIYHLRKTMLENRRGVLLVKTNSELYQWLFESPDNHLPGITLDKKKSLGSITVYRYAIED